MVVYNLAVILRGSRNDAEFLLVRQTRPPSFGDAEYDSCSDSDLWDLPSTEFNLSEGKFDPVIAIEGLESCSKRNELRNLDFDLAIHRVMDKIGIKESECRQWRFWRFIEEAEFGPGLPVHTVFLVANLAVEVHKFQESCRWMSIESCQSLLVEVKPGSDRVGPLIAVGILNDSRDSKTWKVPRSINYQEYPPGVAIVPMRSRTLKPFSTTNLIVFAPDSSSNNDENSGFVACGDALIVDPGCHSALNGELREIVASLPKKLVVFVTHHHLDHIDGLSIVQQSNPDAVVLAHENTMRRIGKDIWSSGYTSISGGEVICIRGQRLSVIFAPGHTDGHMALHHTSTNSVIVGDHCVGQGSAMLDIKSGGNMKEYFDTTYKFMELSPHALIPMHGRVNLWPKHMLSGYLKNRRSREMEILRAIENGAHTLFDIVAKVYSDVDRRFWIPAGSNVRLHVDNLAHQDKLPKEFSVKMFQKTCHLRFLSRWVLAYMAWSFKSKCPNNKGLKLLTASAVVGIAVFYSLKK